LSVILSGLQIWSLITKKEKQKVFDYESIEDEMWAGKREDVTGD
jgi:hypothetical protein